MSALILKFFNHSVSTAEVMRNWLLSTSRNIPSIMLSEVQVTQLSLELGTSRM